MREVIVDTNLLVLLVVGSYRRDLIGGRHKCCAVFDQEDYRLLTGLFNRRSADRDDPSYTGRGPDKTKLTAYMTAFMRDEVHVASAEAAEAPYFARLGLPDAAILHLPRDIDLLTNDPDLYEQASRMGRQVTYFLYYRESVSPR